MHGQTSYLFFMENPTLPTSAAYDPMAAPKPNNWLVPAILVTLFCCNWLGIVGVVYAARVDTKYNHGDYAGATEDARQARLWTLIPLAIGVVFWLLFMAFYGFVFFAAMREGKFPVRT
jgi:hypothetical protein